MEQKLFTESFFAKNSYFEKELHLSPEKLEEIRKLIINWQKQCETFTKGVDKETGDSGEFVRIVFREILGYIGKGEDSQNYNYDSEFPIEGGGSSGKKGFSDLAIGFFTKTKRQPQVLVEFKDQSSSDLLKRSSRKDALSPVDQCWKYLNNTPSAIWGIVTNYNEIRIYHKFWGQNRCEQFYFIVPEELKEKINPISDEKELYKFITLLRKENLIAERGKSFTEEILELQGKEEEKVQDEFYKQYKSLRAEIFYTLLEDNPEYQNEKPKTELLQLVQKFLDRIIFCWFCEDSRERLLPNNILAVEIIENATKERYYSSKGYNIYGTIRDLFYAIDNGHNYGIEEGYNGELFKEDPDLDKLKIRNFIFEKIGSIGMQYDFGNENEVNVNILGHIFEQSISDLEEMRVSFQELDQNAKPLETQKTLKFGEKKLEKLVHKTPQAVYDRKKSKQKKDGVFYTPEYITRYIVENTVGVWLKEKYEECEKMYSQKKINKEYTVLMEYRENFLAKIKILDPACGSGAFLNAAFDYLWKEYLRVANTIKELKSKSSEGFLLDLYSVSKTILEKNLYGVDLNKESVEITKLSLWIKTAAKNKKLNNLGSNIKCGNSLIDDKNIAGDLAFDWEKEFPEIIYPEKIRSQDYYDSNLGNKRMPVLKAYSQNKELSNGENQSGFDIVIGNPPYGAKLEKKIQKYLNEKYIKGSSETAIAFIKLGYDLLNENGFFGFIIPKSYSFSSNYKFIRDYNEPFITEIVDCKKVWKEVKLEQIILLLQKNENKKQYVSSKLYKKSIHKRGNVSKESSKIFGLLLNDISDKELSIGLKIYKTNLFLNDISQNSRGAMIQKLLKPYGNIKVLGGAEIQRYNISGIKGYVDKSIKNEYTNAIIQKNSILVQNIVAHIENPIDHIKIIAHIPDLNYAIVDTVNQIYINDKFSQKYIWILLNSFLINWYVYRFIYGKAIRTMHFDSPVTSRIPIKKIENQTPFINRADTMLSQNKHLQQLNEDFWELFRADFTLEKISQKLEKWYLLDWKEFVAELKKKKIKMTDELEEKWFGRFKRKKEEALKIKETIDTTNAEIDLMVYKLYELTHDEVKIACPEFSMSKKAYDAYEIPLS